MNKRYIPLILVFTAILLLPVLTPFATAYAVQTNSELSYKPWMTKLSPQLLDKSFYNENLFAKLNIPLKKPSTPLNIHIIARVRPGQAKVIILASPLTDIGFILKHTKGIIFAYKLPRYWYIEAWATYNDVVSLAKTPYIFKIIAQESPVKQILGEQNNGPQSSRLPGVGRAEPTLYAAAKTIGATQVWKQYNITGKGITVAVVDTGVDFGISDLGVGAIARTPNGIPMIFDVDELGLTLTLSKAIDENGILKVELPVTFFIWPGIIGQTNDGWVLYVSPAGHTYLVTFPLGEFKVGNIHSKDNLFKFGIAVETVYPQYGEMGILQYTVPIILADTNDDGKYDTVYADLSTTYYYIMYVLHEAGIVPAPNPAWADFSFADEKPAYYGQEVMARDFNGDGVNDFSAGELAGWVYDWLGILTGYTREYGWDKDWEYNAVILPGLDPNGYYVDIAYDWLGHGTSCASVIASRGRVAYNLGYGVFHLKGIAPNAKIASTPGFLINAFTAEFFWSGFSAVNNMPWNWQYTGEHKVNIISNSWGMSYIGIVGFASGMDPMSMMVNYLVSETGTIIVFAMGNGGPGYGTVTMPAAASLVISVGASTLFAYRPLYGYLPAPGGEVVSWSDRGPTDMGVAKPDVVNIGSFAWAPAPWHFGLGNGLGAYDLFGGTSEATPMTAGSIALILQAYHE
ncbi:MAG: S8 family serine peptidase, partial [Crenarchaeota archaeon]|nr:S8 family serine peptidase [Thermoproteota archaeon]